MTRINSMNRKLLVSVFNPQEAREAVLGGGRIVDSEDPRSALGNITPHHIMAISDAVLNYSRDLEVQLSTNIGEDQLLFKRSALGQAIQKSPYEIAGKAAQSAIGVACAMGTRVHPCNIVKVGVDGMSVDLVKEVLREVVLTLNRTEQFCHCRVMAVFFAQDMKTWNERKREKEIRERLVELREFHSAEKTHPDAFDLCDYAVNTLQDKNGKILFTTRKQVSLKSLQQHEVLPNDAKHTWVALNELFPHKTYFPGVPVGDKTNKEIIKAMVDATAEAEADGIMIDTQIQSKVTRTCVVDTSSPGLVDINKFDVHAANPKLTRKGILSLEELKFFVEYCHYKRIEADVAGSVQSYQAQQLWIQIPELDQIATRDAASAVDRDPYPKGEEGMDTRQHRVIKRHLVSGMAPPEHGGILNLPISMKKNPEATKAIDLLSKTLTEGRRKQGLPELKCYFVNKYGIAEPIP